MTGTIVRVVHERGFAFARRPDGSDIFIHVSNLRDREQFDALRGGELVEFSIAVEKRIPGKVSALDVVVIG